MTQQANPFFGQPILNSSYEEPSRRYPLDAEGQPLNELPRDRRRKTVLAALYSHYQETLEKWRQSGIDAPPVFVVVCNNTSALKLVYEWILGWQWAITEDSEELRTVYHGHLPFFSNFDEHGDRRACPNTPARLSWKIVELSWVRCVAAR